MEHHLIELDRGTVVGRAALEGKIVHIADVLADPDTPGLRPPKWAAFAHPRCSDDAGRRPDRRSDLDALEVQPFTDKQIELV